MPRRNHRESYEPLDLTPEVISTAPIYRRVSNRTTNDLVRDHERAERAKRELQERQANARINGGIDWSVCLVPGCGGQVGQNGPLKHEHARPELRNHKWALPLCIDHLYVVFEQAKRAADENLPVCVEANARVKLQRQAVLDANYDEAKAAHLASIDGHIYFVRLNGLVKAGWSREVDARLRAYGPDVEVLCVYPGTRDDETNLHRQLRPVLARGREWYEDGPVVADYVAKMVAQHGEPVIYTTWTRPKVIVGGKMH